MTIKHSDFLITEPPVINAPDVFKNELDITWAFDFVDGPTLDSGRERFDGNFQATTHLIGDRLWDKIPIENIILHHEVDCKNHDVLYQYNNEYFRCDDFTRDHDGIHVLFAGCSETEGVGGRLNQTWTKKLYNELSKEFKLSGFYSIGRAGFGWQKIIANFMIYAEKYGFPDYFFVLLPNLTREYRYNNTEKQYRYYQLYPETYSVQDNGLYTLGRIKDISPRDFHLHHTISIEDYRKSFLDFKLSWKLFEKFCEKNGTKILWTSYESLDSKNYAKIGISDNFFYMHHDKMNEFLHSVDNSQIHKYSFEFRDGHRGELIKEYWADQFLQKIRSRKIMDNEKK